MASDARNLRTTVRGYFKRLSTPRQEAMKDKQHKGPYTLKEDEIIE